MTKPRTAQTIPAKPTTLSTELLKAIRGGVESGLPTGQRIHKPIYF